MHTQTRVALRGARCARQPTPRRASDASTPPATSSADVDTTAPQPPGKPRNRLWEPRFSAPQVLAIALLGPAFVGIMTWMVDPGRTWWSYSLEAIGAGWFSPLVILVIVAVLLAVNEFRGLRRARYVLRGSSLMLGVAATRARYYHEQGESNAWDLATYDVTNYLHRRVSRETLRSWETAAFDWYDTHPAAQQLPKPPAALHEDLG